MVAVRCGVGEADAGEAVFGVGEAGERAAEDGGQGDVLLRVVEEGEQRPHVADFHGLEVALAALAEDGDAGGAEGVGVLVGLELHRAQEDDDVAVLDRAADRPGGGAVGDEHARGGVVDAHECADAAGDEGGLALAAVEGLSGSSSRVGGGGTSWGGGGARGGSREGAGGGVGEGGAGVEVVGGVVLDVRRGGGHERAKIWLRTWSRGPRLRKLAWRSITSPAGNEDPYPTLSQGRRRRSSIGTVGALGEGGCGLNLA